MKRVLILSILILLATASVFALGGYEDVILYQPTNVPNNQGAMIELSTAKSLTDTDFKDNINTVYQPSFKNNLALFAIVDTMKDQKGNVRTVKMTIRSDFSDGFYFVKDGNETNKVGFSLDAFIIEFRLGFGYSLNNRKSFTTEITIGESRKTSFIRSDVGGSFAYELSMPSTGYTIDYPNYPKYYYVCANIPERNNLEDGEYTAKLYLSCPDMNLDDVPITVKGYVGEKPTEITTDTYSFFVSNGDDTFFSNLSVVKGTPSPPLDVAQIQFFFTQSNKFYRNSPPEEAVRQEKFKIYISPTSEYSIPGEYMFKRTGTENQSDVDNYANRIFYELDTDMTEGLTQYGATNTYYFMPKYSSQLTKEGAGWNPQDTYQETWQLNEKHIYIKVSEDSKEILEPQEGQQKMMHEAGTYYSYIYFTVEAN